MESILAAPRDAAAGQVVGRELDGDLVAGVNADEIHAHLAGDVGHDAVPVGQFYLEHGIGQRLNDLAFHFDDIVLGQSGLTLPAFFGRLHAPCLVRDGEKHLADIAVHQLPGLVFFHDFRELPGAGRQMLTPFFLQMADFSGVPVAHHHKFGVQRIYSIPACNLVFNCPCV